MDNSSIQRMLELNTRLENSKSTRKGKINERRGISNKEDLDMLIQEYDQKVYGPPQQSEEDKERYDPRKELEHLKQINANGGRSVVNLEGKNIPKEILESILDNPLDMPINNDLDDVEQKLKGKIPGIKAAADILKRVEKRKEEGKAKINENITIDEKHNGIDYNVIQRIVDNAIDNKLSEIKNSLNESVGRQNTYVPSMKVMNFKDKFYFVDNDNNVFECEMKYKGRKKKS